MVTTPTTQLDPRYGDEGAGPTPWATVEALLTDAALYWLTTVRPAGSPHQTPLLGIYGDGALHICTGPEEAKARHIARNDQVLVSTGTNTLQGTDVVVEGRAARVTAEDELATLARAWEDKYGADWHFDVAGGAFVHADGGAAHVFRVEPTRAYAFGKDPYSQTRYTFG
jgi:general stress protein 26